MTNKSVELKACPFCGGEARILKGHHYWAVCPECAARGSAYGERGNAIKAWNTRTPEAQWISVEDRLPEEEGEYIFHYKYYEPETGYYSSISTAHYTPKIHREPRCEHCGHRAIYGTIDPEATHWMPLPSAPVCETDKEER